MSTEDNSGVKAHREQLTPCPQREVLAVAGFALLEFLRRLPVISFAKEFLIRDPATATEKLTDILKRTASDRERLAHVTTHRKRRMGTLAAKKRLRDLYAVRVVGFWNDLRDHLGRPDFLT
jgi:hypothetical protein